MASFDRGTKRQCQHCSTKFYDLSRDPILCPSCGEKFLLEKEKPVVVEEPAPSKAEEAKTETETEPTATTEASAESSSPASSPASGPEIISLDEAEKEEEEEGGEEIPDVDDVEVDDTLGGDSQDAFLEVDDEDDDNVGIEITSTKDET